MKLRFPILLCAPLMLIGVIAHAADRSVVLSIPGMNCPSCPYMLERTLESVAGVAAASAELDSRTCTVAFDDELVAVEALLQATASIGYPSAVVPPPER